MQNQSIKKAALFDLDGIAIVGRKRFFSIRLAEELSIPNEAVQEFFTKDLKPCSFGKADLKEQIAPYLDKWGWQGTVDDLLQYWFESESTRDEEVLSIVRALREKGVKCYIATRQEKYRMQYLLDVVGLKEYFDSTFVTCEVGYDKSEPEFFIHALNELGLKPEEVLFFDDTQKNVDTARALGIDAHFYDSIEVLKRETNSILH
jgi:putative hydrolase of the HAD superfamily